MRRSIICFLICAGAAGCAGTSSYGYGTTGYYDDYGYGYGVGAYTHPQLAYVRPGVYAVPNWNRPVFYANNSYWLYSDGAWFRSPYHTHGWSRATPPRAVLRIDRPSRYRYYRPTGARYYTPRSYQRGYTPRYQDRGDRRRYYGRGYYQGVRGDRYDRRQRYVPQRRVTPRRYERSVPRGRFDRRDRVRRRIE